MGGGQNLGGGTKFKIQKNTKKKIGENTKEGFVLWMGNRVQANSNTNEHARRKRNQGNNNQEWATKLHLRDRVGVDVGGLQSCKGGKKTGPLEAKSTSSLNTYSNS